MKDSNVGINCQVTDDVESYSLELPTTFFDSIPNEDSTTLYDCVIGYTNRDLYNSSVPLPYNEIRESNIITANILDGAQSLPNIRRRLFVPIKDFNRYSSCNSFKIKAPINASLVPLLSTINENDNIEFPACNFWAQTINSWSNTDCFISNYTTNYVECSCTHLTTFKLSIKDFRPVANKINLKDTLRWENFINHPNAWITWLCITIILGIIFYCNPKSKNDRDRPAIAYKDVIFKSERNKLLRTEMIAQEINYLESYVPNKNEIGNGCCKMVCKKSDDELKLVTSIDQREIDEKPVTNWCKLTCKLWVVYLRNDHTLLSLFVRSSGTNFTTRQRIACFYMYLMTLLAVDAIFYGQEEPRFGHLTVSLIGSLAGTMPVFLAKFFIKSAKPTQKERTIKIPEGQNKDEVNKVIEYYRKNKQFTEQKVIHEVLLSVKDDSPAKAKIAEEIRAVIYDQTFDFPHYFLYIGRVLIVIWSIAGSIIAILYGMSFDIKYTRENETKPFGCPNLNLEYSLLNGLTDIKIDTSNEILYEYSNLPDNYGFTNDSGTWLWALFQSFLLSTFLWQPITIYIITLVKMYAFCWGLRLSVGPGNMTKVQKRCCTCCSKNSGPVEDKMNLQNTVSQSNESNSAGGTGNTNEQAIELQIFDENLLSTDDIGESDNENKIDNDDGNTQKRHQSTASAGLSLFDNMSKNMNTIKKNYITGTWGAKKRRGVVVYGKRVMDVVGYFGHDILFTDKDHMLSNNNNNDSNEDSNSIKNEQTNLINTNNDDNDDPVDAEFKEFKSGDLPNKKKDKNWLINDLKSIHYGELISSDDGNITLNQFIEYYKSKGMKDEDIITNVYKQINTNNNDVITSNDYEKWKENI